MPRRPGEGRRDPAADAKEGEMLGYVFCARCGQPLVGVGEDLCRDCLLTLAPRPRKQVRAR